MKIKNILKVTLLLVILASAEEVNAQQQVMYTQYMFNQLAINPAYTGSHESVSISLLARNQWVGLDGAPTTETFSIHSPMKKEKIALGFVYSHDNIGVTNRHSAYMTYAYRIKLGEHRKLSMGLQAGGTNYRNGLSGLALLDPTDINFQNDKRPFAFNFGAGVFYSTQRFYAGVSVPNLANNVYDKDNGASKASESRHFFASTGYVFEINRHLKLKPAVLIKAVEGAPLEMDINANLLFKEVIWLGLTWRSFDSFDALMELQLTEQLRLGYAYDFATTTKLGQVQAGSHELMLNFRMKYSRDKIITPRYF